MQLFSYRKGPSARFRELAIWMIPPARGWRRKTPSVFHGPFFQPLVGLVTVMFLLGLGVIAMDPEHRTTWVAAEVFLFFLGLACILILLRRIHDQLLQPLAHLRNWALRMRGGNLSARIPVPDRGEFAELARDINSLAESLQTLTQDMDRQVQLQTDRLEQKTRSLEVLYDISATVNSSRDLDDLLTRFLSTLMKIVNARAAAVRLLQDNNMMRLVASIGLEEGVAERERLMPINSCVCGAAVSAGQVQCQTDVSKCGAQIGRPLLPHQELEMIAVPLQYRGKTLGVYNLFVDPNPRNQQWQDWRSLLNTIGQHLGMAIEKAHLDAASQRLSIMQERAMLAHELHDSLAQTLASLRMQVKMHQETLADSNDAAAQDELSHIKEGLDQAYTELRELLDNFRVRMDERGLLPAIEDFLRRFRADTGIKVFLQRQCGTIDLPPSYEVQVLRIIQEAFANIRKHSQAKTARLLLSCNHDGDYRVLVEDDGLGHLATREVEDGMPGEHIGLSVMTERARQLSGELHIESEPGEGTRVELTFHYPTISNVL